MEILNNLLEVLMPILTFVATIVIPAVGIKLMQKWGIDIEANHRDALQSALRNAAIIAVAKLSPSKGNDIASVPVSVAVEYVKSSVPDAVKKFDLNGSKITDLLAPHIADVISQKIR